MTMGDHDMVVVIDAPTDEAMGQIRARARRRRQRADEDAEGVLLETEYRAIIGSLA